MMENYKCEITLRTKVRRCWHLLMLFFLIGLAIVIVYSSNQQASALMNPWMIRSLSSRSYINISTDASLDRYFVEYPHPYQFVMDEPDRCWKESPFLVLMVPVEPHNREARDIIRNTWGTETTVLGYVVRHYFLLGLSAEREETNKAFQEELRLESQKHHDILQSNFVDSYKNLTIKTMVMLEWLSTHCSNTSYAMKIDSDIFLNVHKLVELLLKAPRQLYMTGHVVRDALVLRDQDSKWFMPVSVFPDSIYPPYVLGLGYVFTLDLTRKILGASSHIRAVYIEDVYVGLCLQHQGIEVTDPPDGGLFQAGMPVYQSGCHWTSVITTILESSQQLLDIWGVYETQTQSGCSSI